VDVRREVGLVSRFEDAAVISVDGFGDFIELDGGTRLRIGACPRRMAASVLLKW
jgi:hypothetical protein